MPIYRIKDLAIQVGSVNITLKTPCLNPSLCRLATNQPTQCPQASRLPTDCWFQSRPPWTTKTWPTTWPTTCGGTEPTTYLETVKETVIDPREAVASIEELRAQLKQTLVELDDVQEKVVGVAPQTIEELSAVEVELTQALEEVKARKGQLKPQRPQRPR